MPTEEQLLTLRTQIAPAAFSAARLTGIPAEFICAQAILESGWLKHAPGNNCFGIKSYAGEQGRQLLDTKEWFTDDELARFLARGDERTASLVQPVQIRPSGRKLYQVKDWFATFARLSDCFKKRALLFTEGRYAHFTRNYRETGNLEAFVRGIAPIYATDPQYADKVLEIARMKAVTDIVDELHTALTGYGKVTT